MSVTPEQTVPVPAEPVVALPEIVEPTPAEMEDTSTFEEAARLWPSIGKYRKFIASVVTTAVPLAIYLTDTRSAKEVLAAAGAYLLTNLGVYGVSND